MSCPEVSVEFAEDIYNLSDIEVWFEVTHAGRDLHMKTANRQMPTCTLPIAVKIFFDPDSCSQS